MKKRWLLLCLPSLVLLACVCGSAQTTPLIKRTITRTDRFDFGAGGTVAITGAPVGSIRVTSAVGNEIEINAEIELQAATEADLTRLAAVTNFVTEEAPGRTGIITVGTHNKLGDKKLWKKFPKNLLGLPFTVNYDIRVPKYTDLEINGGKGDLTIKGVQGSMAINFVNTKADIETISGNTSVTVTSGSVDIALGVKGWAGRQASIQVGSGDLTVRLPSNTSAEIDASILRSGQIVNSIPDLKQRDRKVPFTDKAIMAKAGVGGASVKFTVGDGTLRMERFTGPK
jgi:hypothetical protein